MYVCMYMTRNVYLYKSITILISLKPDLNFVRIYISDDCLLQRSSVVDLCVSYVNCYPRDCRVLRLYIIDPFKYRAISFDSRMSTCQWICKCKGSIKDDLLYDVVRSNLRTTKYLGIISHIQRSILIWLIQYMSILFSRVQLVNQGVMNVPINDSRGESSLR